MVGTGEIRFWGEQYGREFDFSVEKTCCLDELAAASALCLSGLVPARQGFSGAFGPRAFPGGGANVRA